MYVCIYIFLDVYICAYIYIYSWMYDFALKHDQPTRSYTLKEN